MFKSAASELLIKARDFIAGGHRKVYLYVYTTILLQHHIPKLDELTVLVKD